MILIKKQVNMSCLKDIGSLVYKFPTLIRWNDESVYEKECISSAMQLTLGFLIDKNRLSHGQNGLFVIFYGLA